MKDVNESVFFNHFSKIDDFEEEQKSSSSSEESEDEWEEFNETGHRRGGFKWRRPSEERNELSESTDSEIEESELSDDLIESFNAG